MWTLECVSPLSYLVRGDRDYLKRTLWDHSTSDSLSVVGFPEAVCKVICDSTALWLRYAIHHRNSTVSRQKECKGHLIRLGEERALSVESKLANTLPGFGVFERFLIDGRARFGFSWYVIVDRPSQIPLQWIPLPRPDFFWWAYRLAFTTRKKTTW
jgi:hypothetical protein